MKELFETKRKLALLLAAAVLLLTSCSTDRTIRRIQKNGTLQVGYASCAPSEDAPFLMAEHTGITAEPAAQIAKTLNVNAAFTRVSSHEAYERLLDGSVDCLWNVTAPEKDMVSAVRTIETGIQYRQLVMTTADSEISRLADVSGKTMAVVSGSDARIALHDAAVMESSLRKIMPYGSMEEVLAALTAGEADCATVDEPQALYWSAKSEGKFRLIETPVAESQLVIATRAEDGALCSRIAEQYVKMAQEGKIRDICAKYTGGNELNSVIQGHQEAV